MGVTPFPYFMLSISQKFMYFTRSFYHKMEHGIISIKKGEPFVMPGGHLFPGLLLVPAAFIVGLAVGIFLVVAMVLFYRKTAARKDEPFTPFRFRGFLLILFLLYLACGFSAGGALQYFLCRPSKSSYLLPLMNYPVSLLICTLSGLSFFAGLFVGFFIGCLRHGFLNPDSERRNPTGRLRRDTIEAPDVREALRKLQESRYTVNNASDVLRWDPQAPLARRELMVTGILLSAGIVCFLADSLTPLAPFWWAGFLLIISPLFAIILLKAEARRINKEAEEQENVVKHESGHGEDQE
jgi:hypothetical protein